MDYSLKFFSRYTRLTQNEELFINKYQNRPLVNRNLKFEALGALTYLQMLLHSDIETGFYYDVSGTRFQLLASKMGISNKSLMQILNWCFEYSLLDEAMFKKYNILTSLKMQDDYAKAKPERRKQNINMNYVYKGCDFTHKYEIALQKWKNVTQNLKNVKQNSGDETRQDDINLDNMRDKQLEIEAFKLSLEKFKKEFPNKKCDDDIPFRSGIDFEELTKAIKESPQFLLIYHKPFDWKWCVENYQTIISGKYDKFKKNTTKESVQNFTGRDYSGTDLNKLFDNPEEINLETLEEANKQ